MKTTERNHSRQEIVDHAGARQPTIVFYSPDMDFCVSFRLLLQNQYTMVTITDPGMLLMTARDFMPEVVIVDCLPTEKMKIRFEVLRRENPHVRILSFYASRFDDRGGHEDLRQSVDAAFSKPLDLAEVTESIHDLMTQSVGGGDVSSCH
ncbi:MAG TPA: hypothetical protein VGR15_10765 [Bacteroidota bacterium]|jgi:DNA-binding response OmpR family regulator|nr:hypothetical protein [Bacteroidota bacterium]